MPFRNDADIAERGSGSSAGYLSAGAFGLFSWLTLSVPYWNWYMFPLNFTLGSLIEQVVGWLLAGAAMAWWLGRTRKAAV